MSGACMFDAFSDCDRGCRKCVRYVPHYECAHCGEVSYGGDIYKIDGEYVCKDCIGNLRNEDALDDFLDDPDIEKKYREHLLEYFSDCLIEGDD